MFVCGGLNISMLQGLTRRKLSYQETRQRLDASSIKRQAPREPCHTLIYANIIIYETTGIPTMATGTGIRRRWIYAYPQQNNIHIYPQQPRAQDFEGFEQRLEHEDTKFTLFPIFPRFFLFSREHEEYTLVFYSECTFSKLSKDDVVANHKLFCHVRFSRTKQLTKCSWCFFFVIVHLGLPRLVPFDANKVKF